MKRKSIIVICAVLVISGVATVLVLTGNRGNVSNVKRVVGYSALYGENSIKEAFDVIEKKFAKDFEGCTHLLNFAMTRMLKTDLQKKLRSITKRITNEGYIIFVFPIIIAQTYVRLSLEHYVPVDSNGEI
jgi:hypothetical protein